MGISSGINLETTPQIIDISTSTITYEGRTEDRTTNNTSSAKWQITRKSLVGNQTIRELCNQSNSYNQIWDNRTTLFPPVPFVNSYSINFDGLNDYIDIPHNTSISFDRLNTFSVSLWIKTTSTNVTYYEKAAAGIGISVYVAGSRLTFELANAAGNRIRIRTTANITYNNGNWHNIFVTYSGSSTAAGALIYIDGSIATTEIQNDTLTLTVANAGPLRLGSNSGGGNNFPGYMDEVSIYDAVVSAPNIALIYNSGIPINVQSGPNGASLRAWWRMGDSDTFPAIIDVVGGNTGTMTNMVAGNIVTVVP